MKGNAVEIVGSGEGARILELLEGTVVVIGIIAGMTVVVVVVETSAKSTGV